MFEKFICWLYDVGIYFDTEYRCVECNHSMSYDVRMYSYGRCPFCGYKHPSACTIVRTHEYAYRTKFVKTGSFFWQYKIVREYTK